LKRVAQGNRASLVDHARRVIAQIGGIEGDLPSYVDIGTVEAWSDTAHLVLEKLAKLIVDGRFAGTDLDTVERLRAWVGSPEAHDAIASGSRLTHGDLKSDQIFVTDDGYRVIDWQRPILAPPDVDLVSVLVDHAIDASEYVDATVCRLFWFLRLHWAVVAQFDLFPGNRWPLFDQWATEATGKILD
jgi:hypothetical protein